LKICINTLQDLPFVAQKVIDFAQNEKIWLFEGTMGAGKTTLIKAICKLLGVKENVSSPTFSIINEYESEKGKIYHFDFYRLQDYKEALAIGTDDYLESGNWCFIEWAGMVAPILPPHYLLIEIDAVLERRTLNLSRQ